MREKSRIIKSPVWENRVSLAVLDTTSLVNEAISRHRLAPTAAAALGRTMTAAAYLCSWLKDENSALSVTVNGGGVGGKICVSGDGALSLRGFIEHPDADLAPRPDGKLDVGGCVGKNGTLTVIRDDGEGIPFTGTCALVSGEIAEDFSAYFLTSEQCPTAIALGVKIGPDGRCVGAGGLFLQPLPGADEDLLLRTEREIAKYSALSSLIAEAGIEEIAKRVEDSSRTEREIRFRCSCSREKTADAVRSLGLADARELVKSEGKISVFCHYCNTAYEFDAEETEALFSLVVER